MNIAKEILKTQKRLGALRAAHGPGRGQCWVCDAVSGTKTARAAYGTRCRRCLDDGATTPDVAAYDALKARLESLVARSRRER